MGVIFQKKERACGKHIDHGVVGGTQKWMNIDTSHLYRSENDDFKFQPHVIEIFKYAYKHIPCVKSAIANFCLPSAVSRWQLAKKHAKVLHTGMHTLT